MSFRDDTVYSLFTDVEIQNQVQTLSMRRNEYLLELGKMVCKQYPVPLSCIPHPLCNWKIQRVAQISDEIAHLAINKKNNDVRNDIFPE